MVGSAISLYNYDVNDQPIRTRVNSCGRMQCSSDWSWDTGPGLLDFDLIAIHGGSGCYRAPEKGFQVRRGSCLVLRPGIRYVGSHDPEDPMDVTWVHFEYLGPAGRAVRPPGKELPPLHRALQSADFCFELMGRLLAAFRSGKKGEAEIWLGAVLSELARQDARPERSGAERERALAIEELCASIRREPGARWRVSELARSFYVTPDHFGRMFRKYAGATPGEFVLRARIDAAMGLLRSSSHSVTRIAELLGYSDVYAFSRQFKLRTGLAPTAFRRA